MADVYKEAPKPDIRDKHQPVYDEKASSHPLIFSEDCGDPANYLNESNQDDSARNNFAQVLTTIADYLYLLKNDRRGLTKCTCCMYL